MDMPEGGLASVYEAIAQKAYDHALSLALQIVKNTPKNAKAHELLTHIHGQLGQWQEMLAHAEMAASYGHITPVIFKARAFRFWQQRRYDKARAEMERAFEIFPEDHTLLLQILNYRLHENLSRETYQEFLKDYSQTSSKMGGPANVELWRGQNIGDDSLFFLAIGGFGDVIMLSRFLPLIRKHGLCQGAIHIAVQPELLSLLSRSFGKDLTFQPITQGAQSLGVLPGKKVYSAKIWYIPQAFALPAGETVPYLFLDNRKKNEARKLLPKTARARIGLIVHGDRDGGVYGLGRTQQIPLQTLACLRKLQGIDWLIMEPKATTEKRRALCGAVCGQDVSGHIADFDDWAALLAHCDAVVTIDTGGLHLAGAMGIPGWLVLHNPVCWRWPKHDGSSGWYPQIRILHHAGDWDYVGAQLVRQIGEWQCEKRFV
ncbi:MAG: glycosyltransferase family 9 protein [Pseudomonadota bacterium]